MKRGLPQIVIKTYVVISAVNFFSLFSNLPLEDRLSIRYEHGKARIIKSFSFDEQSVFTVLVSLS